MTITTPAQMREAAARLAEADANEVDADLGIKLWLRGLAASIRLLPGAEPEPQAVRVTPLSDEDRDWIDARADELFRASERARGGIRHQTITPQDFRDYFVVTATRERILSQIEAVSVAQVRAEALREAEKALRDWQDDLNVQRMPDAAITVGMAADVVGEMMEKPTR